jgi:protein-tyrosine phosphatase
MIADYRAMPEVHAHSLAAVFRNLAEGRVPLAVNCSAGKDRTGLASAIILASLGVPMITVIEDYALSDRIVDYRAELAKDASSNAMAAKLSAMPWPVVRPLMASDPAYIEAAFGAIEQKYGSLDAYLESRLGVTAQMRAAMRARLLEEVRWP